MTVRAPGKQQRSRRKKAGGTQAASGAPPPAAPPLIVGIGASAGGLAAFKVFFTHMPAHSGMAFVLVQHLDPHHESMLVDLLGRQTTMTVVEAEDRMPVVANRVFIIPPDATLTIKGGVLRVSKPAPAREHRRPIDTFFSALAEDQGENAVCIVLAGTGSDGTLGLRTIKERGGLTLAQAEFDSQAMSGMPQSAAATGLVDHIMPAEDMPATLVAYRRHLASVAGRKDDDGHRRDMAEHLPRIAAILRSGTGHDFRQYKANTLIRRVQRRMQVLRIDTASAFLDVLRKEPSEVDLLFREFLIGVTQFFRDPLAFDALQATVVPKLLENKGTDDHVRIWVPGCATGEEVYSIAILLGEAMERHSAAPKVHIFGTDIDAAAVAVARAARYRKAMAGVSPERAERWFAEDGDESCPIKEIREMCVFSTQSVIKDAPFSKLDLISCRNLLIYMEADLQARVMRTFHYALRPGGYLCLGQSEAITRNAKLFVAIVKKHRIYQRLETATPSLPDFSPAAPDVPTPPRTGATRTAARVPVRIDYGVRRVMEKHSPAYVVIDKKHEILRFSGGDVGGYLEPSPGTASLNLFSIVRKALRPVLRAAVRKAYEADEPVATEKMAIKIDGKRRSVRLIVEPIPEGGAEAGLCVVVFQDAGSAVAGGDAKAPDEAPHSDLRAMEHDLRTTKEQLQATIDELEFVNEEMNSANEEYQSVNEELQSSNEELETAKEEMQSVNEELQTLNDEMSGKNEALTRLNSDLKNLLDSTQIATIFLDDRLRIRTFTPAMTDLFHLRDSDRGRPVTDIVTRLIDADFRSDVKKVLRTLAVVEHEMRLADGSIFLMRIIPYRAVDNVIDGVVITFMDISARKRHEEASARLAAIVDSSEDAIIGHSLDGLVASWNAGAEKIFGFTAGEAVGKPLSILLSGEQQDVVPGILEALKRGERIEHFEIDRVRKDGERIDVSLTISPVKDGSGHMVSASTIAREFTQRKLVEDHKSMLIAELDHRIKNTLAIVTSLIAQTLKATDSPEAFVESIQGRIQALSRVHYLLTQSHRDRAELRDVVRGELEPYGKHGENIVTGGEEDVILMPKATQTLAMALHELATNATKYGALSTPKGRIEVTWRVLNTPGERRVSLKWVESGGPRVFQPSRRGFGSGLIERAVAYELGAHVSRDFHPEGVRCTIEFSLTEKTGYVQEGDRDGT